MVARAVKPITRPDDSLEFARLQGVVARLSKRPDPGKLTNPYHEDSEQWSAFVEGWFDAENKPGADVGSNIGDILRRNTHD
jgi:hypothetical protein